MTILYWLAAIAAVIVALRLWIASLKLNLPFEDREKNKQVLHTPRPVEKDFSDEDLYRDRTERNRLRRLRHLTVLKLSRNQLDVQLAHRYGELAYFTLPGKRRQYARFTTSLGVYRLLVKVWVRDDEWHDGKPLIDGKDFDEFVGNIPRIIDNYPVDVQVAQFPLAS